MIRSHQLHSLFLLCFILIVLTDCVYCEDFEYFDSFQLLPYDNHYSQKCCPVNFKYEKSERKCIESNDTSIVEMVPFLIDEKIRVGLFGCEVIVDHVLFLDDLKTLIGNNGVIEYENETFPPAEYCVDTLENDDVQELQGFQKAYNHKKDKAILRLCYKSDYCTKRRGLKCLKKCCPDGEVILNTTCRFQPQYGFPTELYKNMITNLSDKFAIFNQKITHNEICRLSNISDYLEAVISENGSKLVDVEEEPFCFELHLTDRNTPAEPVLLVCEPARYFIVDTPNFTIWLTVRLISCIFLIGTMVVHVFVYKLEKVLHRIVLNYCLARLIAFAAITYSYLYGTIGDKYCIHLSFVLLFGLHAGFSWLTVMCFDMWRTISSMEATEVVDKNKSGVKRTFYYCLYAWSLPTLVTIFCYIEYIYNILPHYLHANIGEYVCFIEYGEGNYGRLLFISPLPIAAIANVVFFTLTLRYIIKVTDSIRKMKDNTNEKNQLCATINNTCIALKLFLMMGINWCVDIVTYLINFKDVHETNFYIELFIEVLNCCQGIYIFWIFLLKWTLARSIITRFTLFVTTSVDRIKTIFCGTSVKTTDYEMATTTPYSK